MAKECENESCSKESCEGCPSRQGKPDFSEPLNAHSSVKHVIGVVSGKGGVGKSMVTSLLAVATAKKGYKTAILDGDITGPSIPKAFGVNARPVAGEKGLEPVCSEKYGIKIMSTNLILESETDPVVWRGPVVGNMVKQFWSEVHWGEIDYMFVDMPPGTGDVPLTVYQSLPVESVIVVTSPQSLVKMIVEKAVRMADLMHIQVSGIIENMSYLECPDCGKKIPVFGESQMDEIAQEYGISSVARMPINPKLAALSDMGTIELYEDHALEPIVDKVIDKQEQE